MYKEDKSSHLPFNKTHSRECVVQRRQNRKNRTFSGQTKMNIILWTTNPQTLYINLNCGTEGTNI